MEVTVPLVVIVGVIVFISWRYLGLRLWHALIALAFGFLLAATTLAPSIRTVINGIAQWITGQ
jgi:cell division protein FtsW (lipid II flippase)